MYIYIYILANIVTAIFTQNKSLLFELAAWIEMAFNMHLSFQECTFLIDQSLKEDLKVFSKELSNELLIL